MITDIIFVTGGSAAWITSCFRWAHRQILMEYGIVAVNITDAFPQPHYQEKDAASLVKDAGFAPLARQALNSLQRDRPAKPEFLIVHNFCWSENPQRLALQSALCRHFFPDIRQRAIFIATRADDEVEATCTRLLVFGSSLQIPLALQQCAAKQPFLEKTFSILEKQFGKDAVASISYRNPEQMCRELVAAIICTQPDTQKDISALPAGIAPVGTVLPRDVLAFMEGVNQLFAIPGSNQYSPYSWNKFTPFLRGGASSSQLLSPELRTELQQKFDMADVKALARRGLPLWKKREASATIPHESFPGLTDDVACRLAKLLPPTHVDMLLKGPHLSERYQTYGARQCLSALQKAHSGKISSAKMICSSTDQPQAKVSVLTLAYNHAPYIAECIESVIAQKTDFPIQHIIADDGSDDGTQDIILAYAAKYPHIVPVFQKKNSHGPRNIYSMFAMARTEYVALCDGDDYFTDSAKLQIQADLLDAHPGYALCFHIARVVYEGAPEKERLYPPEEILPRGARPFYYLADLIRNNFIQTNSVMYRWRFQNGLPDWFRVDLTPGDRYWHLVHAEQGKIGFINKVMSVYRRHEKSVFYLSEIDALAHRAKIGLKEIEVWDVINKHFDRKYEALILDMVNHIFADCLLYDTRQEELGVLEYSALHQLSDKYPEFALYFLASLDKLTTN